MNSNNVVSFVLSIIALDDDGDFFFEPHDARLCCRQAEAAREREAYIFVLRMAVEMAGRRLQNMRCRQAPGGDTTTVILQEQGSFRLGTGQAELAGVTWQPPRGV